MPSYLRGVVAFSPVILLMAGSRLDAQPPTKVTIDMTVMRAGYRITTTKIHATDGENASLRLGAGPLNMMVRPHVRSAEAVTLHVEVELQNDLSWRGISQPIVNEVDIPLRVGVVHILARFHQPSGTEFLVRLPALTNIPALGSILIAFALDTPHAPGVFSLFGCRKRAFADSQPAFAE
jgi:hypothetical protein